jgi:hypothetical protein
MATGVAGLKSGNHIVPYSQTTKRTKIINEDDLTTSHLVLAGGTMASQAITTADIQAYSDSNGQWRFRFNVSMTCSTETRTSVSLTFSSTYAVVFKDSGYYPVTMFSEAVSRAQAVGGGGVVNGYCAATADGAYRFSGDVPLESEPTWASANLEASTDASVWIEPATDTTAGLLSYYSTTNYPAITNWVNGGTGHTGEIQATRIGNLITVTGSFTSGSDISADTVQASTILDTQYMPTEIIQTCVSINTAGDWAQFVYIDTSGNLQLFQRLFQDNADTVVVSNFATSTKYSFTISYVKY